MIPNRRTATLVGEAMLLVLAMANVGQLAAANPTASVAQLQTSYVVKPVEVKSRMDALAVVRRMVAYNPDWQFSCQRYVVAVNVLKDSSKGLSDLQLIDLTQRPNPEIEAAFNAIPMERKRQLIIETLDEYRKAQVVDQAFVELIDCLSRGFKKVDRNAQVYLSDRDLKQLVGQYKIVFYLPIGLLMASANRLTGEQKKQLEAHKITKFAFKDLHPTIKRMLVSNLRVSEDQIRLMFKGEKPQQVRRELPQAQPVAAEAPLELTPAASAPAGAVVSAVGPNVGQEEPEAGEKEEEEREDELTPEERENLVAEQQYKRQLVTYLHGSWPEKASLFDRCRVLTSAITAERSQLEDEKFPTKLVTDIHEATKANEPAERRSFVPTDEVVRHYVLLFLHQFDPFENLQAAYTWIELATCVNEWNKVDEVVKNYMENPDMSSTAEELVAFIQEAPEESDEEKQKDGGEN